MTDINPEAVECLAEFQDRIDNPRTAETLRALSAALQDYQKGQAYRYIGKDGLPILARDLEDQRDAAIAALAQAQQPCENCGDAIARAKRVDQDRIEARAETAAAYEARTVKPLSWFEVEKSRFGGKYTADGYTIRYIEGLWLLDFAGDSKSTWRFPDLDAAKAAAQSDYSARIMAAITTPADAKAALDRMIAEAEERGMRKAADISRKSCMTGDMFTRNHITSVILAAIPKGGA